jgi:hypothetical protein
LDTADGRISYFQGLGSRLFPTCWPPQRVYECARCQHEVTEVINFKQAS